ISVTGSAIWSSYAVLLGLLGGEVTEQPVIGVLLSLGLAVLLGGAISLGLHVHGRITTAGRGDAPAAARQRLADPSMLDTLGQPATRVGHA
ncbi:MAG: hypothetical protein ACRDRL_17255, partial [Sciscionella sp.]